MDVLAPKPVWPKAGVAAAPKAGEDAAPKGWEPNAGLALNAPAPPPNVFPPPPKVDEPKAGVEAGAPNIGVD